MTDPAFIDDPGNGGSPPGAYARAMKFPPYAGAIDAEGTFRRGNPGNGGRRHDAGDSVARNSSFHSIGDSRA